jgi:hypothetical protein
MPASKTDGTKALAMWSNQGMTDSRPKLRPRDPARLAKLTIDLVSGDVEDRQPTPEERGKDRAAVKRGQLGGIKGGKVRVANLKGAPSRVRAESR